MALFEPDFLDRLRAAVPVSTLVQEKVKLRRAGREWKGVDDPSLTVNDQKGLWWDHGSREEGGDVFRWLQQREGYSYKAAVEAVAQRAGIALPKAASGSSRSSARAPGNNGAVSMPGSASRTERDRGQNARAGFSRREIAATYDYTDSDGTLIYQVIRYEWIEPKDGKRKKTFSQRRPSPDEQGVWINALGAGEFMRRAPGEDWWTYREEGYEKYPAATREIYQFDDGVAHTLFNLPAVTIERLAGENGQMIFITEGEKDALTLIGWGCVATTNSGGAQHWADYHADLLLGCDVVILADNDEAGREGAQKRAKSLRKKARRVRVLNIAAFWAGCPAKGDITDWAEKGGGNLDRFYEIVDKLPDWRPELQISKFGRVAWRDSMKFDSGINYKWIIKGLIPAGESILIYGDSQTGKSFLTFDMAMHVAQGEPYLGKITRAGLVVYCAMEAGRGFRKRMQAFIKDKFEGRAEDLPFDLLTRKADLFGEDVDTDALIAEIRSIADERDMDVAVIVIDTYNAATPGMREIASEDVSRTTTRIDKIREAFGASIWIVHHKNAQGDKPRGHTSLYAGIETAIDIRLRRAPKGAPESQIRRIGSTDCLVDSEGRVIRDAIVLKQREGDDSLRWEFTLRQVTVAHDEDGDAVTSCVVDIPAREITRIRQGDKDAAEKLKPDVPKEGFQLRDGETAFFRCVLEAIRERGVSPASVGLSLATIDRVAEYKLVREIYYRRNLAADDDDAKGRDRLRKAIQRDGAKLSKYDVIGVDNPYIWVTGKKVRMSDGTVYPPQGRDAGEKKTITAAHKGKDRPSDEDLPPPPIRSDRSDVFG